MRKVNKKGHLHGNFLVHGRKKSHTTSQDFNDNSIDQQVKIQIPKFCNVVIKLLTPLPSNTFVTRQPNNNFIPLHQLTLADIDLLQ